MATSPPEVVLFDVGGVLLSNGWDTAARRACVEEMRLDWDEFERRHRRVATAFEMDVIGVEEYLHSVVFFEERPFTPDEFKTHMKAQSRPFPASLAVFDELADGSDRLLLGTLNNESRFLNEHRLDTFGLRERFSLFLSSCYLRTRKPESRIYRMAADVIGVAPDRLLFVDDRPQNLEPADAIGMLTHRFIDADDLRDRLRREGLIR